MGNTIWVQIKDDRNIRGDDRDNSIILKLEKNLAAVARKLKVTKLAKFYDYSELQAEFLDDPGEPMWSDSKAGLASVEAIHDHLKAHPEDLKFTPDRSREHWPRHLMEELAYCHAQLKEAAATSQKFRLLIVP